MTETNKPAAPALGEILAPVLAEIVKSLQPLLIEAARQAAPALLQALRPYLGQIIKSLIFGGSPFGVVSPTAPLPVDAAGELVLPRPAPPAPSVGGLTEITRRPTVQLGGIAAILTMIAQAFGVVDDPQMLHGLYASSAGVAGAGALGTFKIAKEQLTTALNKTAPR
jgi:hypothetical protein